MHHIVLFVFVGGVAIVVGGILIFAAFHRPARAIAPVRLPEPRSLVRVLSTEDEITDAAQRAAAFERNVSARCANRADTIVTSKSHSPTRATVREIGQRSA